MKNEVIGNSVKERPIEAWHFTEGPRVLLLIGGVHGDEPEGIELVKNYLEKGPWAELSGKAELIVIPQMNPDGCYRQTRLNANKVDLNRNMPTKDWSAEIVKERYHPGPSAGSEPETIALVGFIEKIKPHFILSAHSWEPLINYNGPSRNVAEHMAKLNAYKVEEYIGYPTPGSLGTWAGWERKIPTITLEIERGISVEKAWEVHGEALHAAMIFASENETLG